MGSYEQCIQDCVAALERNGMFSKAHARLAKSYMALGDLARALEAYEKAVDVSPTDRDLVGEYEQCKQVQAVFHNLAYQSEDTL